MEDLSGMTVAELEELLANLRADLQEVEEERDFVLKQTGLHLSAKEVTKFEKEPTSLQTQIGEAERALQSRNS